MRGRRAAGSLVRPVVRKCSPGGRGGRAARPGRRFAEGTWVGRGSAFPTGAHVPITDTRSRCLGLLGAEELVGPSHGPADSGTEM